MLLNACVPPLPHLTSDLLQRLTFITCESISARFHEARVKILQPGLYPCNPSSLTLTTPMCGSQGREGGGHCGHCVPHNPLFSWLDWHRFLEASRTSGGQKRFHNQRQCSTGKIDNIQGGLDWNRRNINERVNQHDIARQGMTWHEGSKQGRQGKDARWPSYGGMTGIWELTGQQELNTEERK